MPRYFMQDTSLAHMEKTMMRPPRFRPRGGGVYLSRYKYTAADCDCGYCLKAEREKKPCGEPTECVCFEERLAAGCWTHGELAGYLIREIAIKRLADRTRRLLPLQTSTPFKDRAHHQRMTSITAAIKREPFPYTAAVFLLSADPTLWKKSRQALRDGAVDFEKIDIRGITPDGYALLQTAKDLYYGGCRVTTDELCDPHIIGDRLFRLIISAFVIRRYGLPDKATFSYIVSRFFRTYLPGERGFSENTIVSYRDTFKQFFTYCSDAYGIPPEKLKISDFSRDVVTEFLAKLESEGRSVSTRNQRLAELKSFFGFVKFAYPEHLDTASSILAMRMKKQPEPTICYMSAEGVACLLRQPDARTRADYRDMLILTLLYDSGARVSEIIKTRVGDIRVQNPATIILHGKGSKDRIVPLSEKVVALVKQYLDSENLGRPERRDKLLFVNHSGEQLTRAGAAYILRKYVDMARAEEPALIPDKFSPHCMRHSKAMHLLQAGVALIYIRDFLGHNSIMMTEVYAKADSKTKRAALETAYSDMHISDPTLTASWNNDASLMRFLENLCAN